MQAVRIAVYLGGATGAWVSEVECSLDQEGVFELDVRQDGWMVH
jgi:hypothetical protein